MQIAVIGAGLIGRAWSIVFSRAGFGILSCEGLVAFQDHGHQSAGRKILRQGTRLLGRMLPRYATDVCLVAERRD